MTEPKNNVRWCRTLLRAVKYHLTLMSLLASFVLMTHDFTVLVTDCLTSFAEAAAVFSRKKKKVQMNQQLAGEHSGAFSNQRVRCFPKVTVETKKHAKSRAISSTYGYCFVSAGWVNKQLFLYTVATTTLQCHDTYAALISLHEGSVGRRNAHAVFRADRVYTCITNVHGRCCYTSMKHILAWW